ncbi:MAG: ribosome recycling factor [Chlamydiae bacterium]|nr:MAG: ribosome recycling factor [Chlamydiota bacterium]
MPYRIIISKAKDKMNHSIEHLHHEFNGIRTGKASPTLVEDIRVEAYGSNMPLKEMAGISTPESRLILIQPWDQNTVPAIVKAIQSSSLGITPVDDGRVVRVPIPELDEERRKELDKHVKHMAEEARVVIRNIRREKNEKLKNMKKNGELTEDDLRDSEKQMQKLTDDFINKIGEALKHKEEEIFTI